MNVRRTKNLFQKNNVVALKADINESPAALQLLRDLGNTATAIPYYAIYSPGAEQPVVFEAYPLTTVRVKDEIAKALQLAEDQLAQASADDPAQVATRATAVAGN